MTRTKFPGGTREYLVFDDVLEIKYYARNGRKFKRVRVIASQEWKDTVEQEIDNDEFWMIVACIERGSHHG
jgi:hypothetical protein